MNRVLIIGGGPGGYIAALRAAQLGETVTLVEKEYLGGTCLNVGCIPTKTLLHTAEVLRLVAKAPDFGVQMKAELDFARAMEHKNEVVAQLVQGIEVLLESQGVTIIRGSARFIDSKKVQVQKPDGSLDELTFDKVIIATGSVNAVPPLPGCDSPQCIDSTGALSLTEVPESLLIIGGGVIGVEIATIYAAMGTNITIVEMMDAILPMMDLEMALLVRSALEGQGVIMHTGAKVLSIEDKGNHAAVQIEKGDSTFELTSEKVLISVGRRPDTSSLDLEAAGVAHEKGRILVDTAQRTSVEGIFAIGDCTGGSMLAHVASVQGEIAAENAAGHKAIFDGKTIPYCVFTQPEFASVGLSEEQVSQANIPCKIGRFPLSANSKAHTMGGEGMVKIIAGEPYGEILGLHIVGPHATDLITEGALALEVEATVDELIATIHAHPTLGEAVREAALAAEGRALHFPGT